jgi:hypothetical protein
MSPPGVHSALAAFYQARSPRVGGRSRPGTHARFNRHPPHNHPGKVAKSVIPHRAGFDIFPPRARVTGPFSDREHDAGARDGANRWARGDLAIVHRANWLPKRGLPGRFAGFVRCLRPSPRGRPGAGLQSLPTGLRALERSDDVRRELSHLPGRRECRPVIPPHHHAVRRAPGRGRCFRGQAGNRSRGQWVGGKPRRAAVACGWNWGSGCHPRRTTRRTGGPFGSGGAVGNRSIDRRWNLDRAAAPTGYAGPTSHPGVDRLGARQVPSTRFSIIGPVRPRVAPTADPAISADGRVAAGAFVADSPLAPRDLRRCLPGFPPLGCRHRNDLSGAGNR